MKPLHVGLLVVGAALAGGLAVRMSQPPPVQMSAALQPPLPVPAATHVVSRSKTLEIMTSVTPPPPITEAPAPVYTEVVQTPLTAPKPKPFAPDPKTVPAIAARVAPMSINPAPYQKPAEAAVKPIPDTTPSPAQPPRPEPEAVSETSKPEPVRDPPPEPRRVTLHQGFQFSVRLDESLSTERAAGGDTFQASLAEPLVADGLIIAERGARVTGRVITSRRAGRFSGSSQLELALVSVVTSDGQKVSISTEPWVKAGDSARGEGTLGAIIGAIAGGGTGGGKPLDLPNDTILRFRLASRVTITERPT